MKLSLFIKLVIIISIIFGSCCLHAYNNKYSNNHLFSINKADGSRSPTESSLKVIQSVEEWNLNINPSIFNHGVNLNNFTKFNIELPTLTGTYESFVAKRLRYTAYSSSERQFIGDLYLNQDSENKNGTLIINIINNKLSGLVLADHGIFEIYTDSVLGPRLANVHGFEFQNDVVPADNFDVLIYDETIEGDIISPPPTSRIDILVLVDLELDEPGIRSQVRERIISQKLDSDAILALSGSPGNRGIPQIDLNIVQIDTIDINDNLELIDTPIGENFICFANPDSDTASPNCDPNINQTIINKRNAVGADIVMIFVDPELPPISPGEPSPYACGQAGLDLRNTGLPRPDNGMDVFLRYRLSTHNISCTNSQFVFLHEILHNFGVGHDLGDTGDGQSGDAVHRHFERYAFGFPRSSDDDTVPVASVMGCSVFEDVPLPPPFNITCNRVMRVSDPNESIRVMDNSGNVINTIIGQPGGSSTQSGADVYRYLTECIIRDDPEYWRKYSKCPRERMAQTLPGNQSDQPPEAHIIAPSSSFFLVSDVIEIDASIFDDNIQFLDQVTWSIIKDGLGEQVQVIETFDDPIASGWRVLTDYFQQPNVINGSTGPGSYTLSVSAIDSVGQISTHSKRLIVFSAPEADIAVELEAIEAVSVFMPEAIMTTVKNLGPFDGENITIDIVYGLEGSSHWIQNVDVPQFCELLPQPDPSTCTNFECDSITRCVISSLNSNEQISIIQRACTWGVPSSLNTTVSIVENIGPADTNSSNDIYTANLPACFYTDPPPE